MFIEESPELILMHAAQHHHRSCACAGCFLSWARDQEVIEYSRNWRRNLVAKRKAQEEITTLQLLGKIPPGEPFGQVVA